MIKRKHAVYALLGTALFYASCSSKSEQAVAPNIANETITQASLKFTNQANVTDTTSCTYTFHVDNNGNVTSVDSTTLTLKANSKYNAVVYMLDQTQSPVFVVSNEIKDRENYHLFFYQPTPINAAPVISNTSPYIPGTPVNTSAAPLNLAIQRTDLDTNNPPLQIGLTTVFTTGAASTGNLRWVLRHQPNAKNGTYYPGSSDLDVNFVTVIK
ncbi:hypothetical protein JN11_00907 [Mucilaginibacter frigoritolerans]|jgi:uncharacterized RmlC-like cupin family protein|uniref:Uncharacterized protein n=1 Tax=Mucilaginibacter frigoritolerans TaxID=652788 RepID=A0A562UCR6_9SPHI|nr:hypothetical protein [Mucilaginibacter frigoritolerans]TWJ03369.1 hypothetical protein JN11_00907 [Mucilaginibacter frigoritolerans]